MAEFCLENLFGLYFKLYSIPKPVLFEWSQKTRQIEICQTSSCGRLIWLTNIFVVIGVLSITSNAITILLNYQTNMMRTLFAVIFFQIGVFDIIFAKSIMRHQTTIVLTLKRMLYSNHALPNKQGAYLNFSNKNLRWRIIKLFLTIAFYEFLAISGFFPAFAIANGKIDAFHFIFKTLITTFPKGVVNFVRFFTNFIYIYETARLSLLFCVLVFYWCEMQVRFLEALKMFYNDPFTFIHLYRKLTLIYGTWKIMYSEWVQLILCILFLDITVCFIAVLRFYANITFDLLLIGLSFALMDTIATILIVPFFVETQTLSTLLLQNWKGRKLSKISRLQMNSLMSISVDFGNWFKITKKAQREYFNAIVERTASGVLLKI